MAEALPPGELAPDAAQDYVGHPDNINFTDYPQYRPLRITACGHSQLPNRLENFDGHIVTTYKHGGARIKHMFDHNSPLYNVWNTPADLVILFLGGNDLADHKKDFVHHIKKELVHVVDELKRYVCPLVIVTLLEERTYDHHPRREFRESPILACYNDIAKKVNLRLKEHAKKTNQFRTALVRGEFLQGRTIDGVHLTPAGLHQLRHVYRCAVMKTLKSQQ